MASQHRAASNFVKPFFILNNPGSGISSQNSLNEICHFNKEIVKIELGVRVGVISVSDGMTGFVMEMT